MSAGLPDIDVLIVGSSLGWSGLQPRVMESEIASQLGRPVKVVLLGTAWRAEDLLHFLVKDFLRYRKAKVVLVEASQESRDTPHEMARLWMRYWPNRLDFVEFPLSTHLSFASVAILGGVRQLWGTLHPNGSLGLSDSVAPFHKQAEERNGGRDDRFGFESRDKTIADLPFSEFNYAVPHSDPREILYEGAHDNDRVVFDRAPLLPHEEILLEMTARQAREVGSFFGLIYVPFRWAMKQNLVRLPPYQRNYLKESPPPSSGLAPPKSFPALVTWKSKSFLLTIDT